VDKLLNVISNQTTASTQPRPKWRHMLDIVSRAAGVYEIVAMTAVSTFLFLAIVNIGLFAGKQIVNAYATEGEFKLREHYLTDLYPDFTKVQLREIDQEMHSCKFKFVPYLGYAYEPVSEKWLHINRHGFRRSADNGPWPPNPNNLNVFVFGGSNVFGYQVTDDQTIPAHLQTLLKGKCSKIVSVYNFGVPDYYSSLEQIQFSNLLENGIRPDVAIFIDGTNDIEHKNDEPLFTSEMTELMDESNANTTEAFHLYLAQLPMMQLVKRTAPECDTRRAVTGAIRTYSENKRMEEAVGNAYKVKTLFVWHPTPSYEYDLKYHPYPQHHQNWSDAKYGYTEMAGIVKSHPQEYGNNFLWLADMQQQATEPLYVDFDNYRPKFCEAIAGEIARKLLHERLITDDPAPPVVRAEERE